MELKNDYFHNSYLLDKREVKFIDGLVRDTSPIFYKFFCENGWPYEIENRKPIAKIADNDFLVHVE